MSEENEKSYSDAECFAEFDRLFPHGFAGADVIAEIRADGRRWIELPSTIRPAIPRLGVSVAELETRQGIGSRFYQTTIADPFVFSGRASKSYSAVCKIIKQLRFHDSHT
jgi:hypothetical protein